MQRSDDAPVTARFFEEEAFMGLLRGGESSDEQGQRLCVFSRLPEATGHVGLISGLKSGSARRVAPESQRLLLSGPQRRLYRVPFPADEALDVALSPAGARDVLGVPLQALADQIIDAEDVWGDSARRAREHLSMASSTS